MWTDELIDEYDTVMRERDDEAREDDGPGLLAIVDAGELNMDALTALFA